MGLFERIFERREAILDENALSTELAAAFSKRPVTVRDALNIPAIAGCVELISGVVSGLPVRLYRDEGGKVTELTDDYRLRLLNDETGDLLDAVQWKKALVRDYLLPGAGYSYVDWEGSQIRGIYYVANSQVSISRNEDPVFKTADFLIGGRYYRHWQMLRILRNTEDGVTGKGVVTDSPEHIAVMMDALAYERNLFRTGARRGFLKATKQLTKEALKELKAAVKRMFSNGSPESLVVLNGGVEFQPMGQTAVDAQLNENKASNGREICKLFCLSPKLFDGGATAEDRRTSAALGIVPVVNALQSALNRFCLLEEEKKSLYFVIDTDELLQGSMLERYQAYEIAAKNGIMQLDEIRYREDMSPLGLNFIKLSLDTVLYDPATGNCYTPNTDKLAKLDNRGRFYSGKGGST
ncbi:phage portal protein [Intestinimonas sp.]|uniref:phage portal protein n=1 Tax=Intestinimonas sp. TaxID=1965293 RepID=UPI003AB57F6C